MFLCKPIYKIYFFIYTSVCIPHVCRCSQWPEKLDPQELELQVLVGWLVWMLETKESNWGPLQEQWVLLTADSSLLAYFYYILQVSTQQKLSNFSCTWVILAKIVGQELNGYSYHCNNLKKSNILHFGAEKNFRTSMYKAEFEFIQKNV